WCPSDLVSVCRLVDSTVLAERGVALPLPDVVLKTGPANLVVQRAVTHGGKHRTDGARVTTRRDNGRRAPRRRPRPRVAPARPSSSGTLGRPGRRVAASRIHGGSNETESGVRDAAPGGRRPRGDEGNPRAVGARRSDGLRHGLVRRA